MRRNVDRWQISLLAVIMLMLGVMTGLALGGQAAFAWSPPSGENVVVDNGRSFSGKTTMGTERPMLTLINTNAIRLNAPPAGAMFFTVANTEMMRISNTGNVGIGDTTPVEGQLVVRNTTGGTGVWGSSVASSGVYGYSDSWRGVKGHSDTGYGVEGESTSSYGVYGKSASSYAGYFDGNVRVTGDLEVGPAPAVKIGRIFLSTGGQIISTDGGTRIISWADASNAILLTNTSGDWTDYWWQTQKGAATAGNSGSVSTDTYNLEIITGIDTNDYGIEVHFGQADGTEGWCSVWLQHVDNKLVGHYIKY